MKTALTNLFLFAFLVLAPYITYAQACGSSAPAESPTYDDSGQTDPGTGGNISVTAGQTWYYDGASDPDDTYADLTLGSGSILIIGANLTITGSFTFPSDATLVIKSGVTLTLSSTTKTIDGTVYNYGTINSSVEITFNTNAKYYNASTSASLTSTQRLNNNGEILNSGNITVDQLNTTVSATGQCMESGATFSIEGNDWINDKLNSWTSPGGNSCLYIGGTDLSVGQDLTATSNFNLCIPDASTVDNPGSATTNNNCASCMFALPIKLVQFSTKHTTQNNYTFEWVTASEINNDFFTIEFSYDGYTFYAATDIAGAGNTSETRSYNTSCTIENNPMYFRLKQTDFDGTETYSKTTTISLGYRNKCTLQSTSNNNSKQIVIGLLLQAPSPVSVTIVNVSNGSVKESKNFKLLMTGNHTIPLQIETGIYIVKITTASDVFQQKIVIY